VEMVVPRGNRRGSDLRRTCQYVARFPATTSGQARPEDARLPAVQKGGSSGGRGLYEAKRIRSHYLPLPAERLPGFCTPLRYNAKPHSILSMARLCVFAE
jgi:hypothetical protein